MLCRQVNAAMNSNRTGWKIAIFGNISTSLVPLPASIPFNTNIKHVSKLSGFSNTAVSADT